MLGNAAEMASGTHWSQLSFKTVNLQVRRVTLRDVEELRRSAVPCPAVPCRTMPRYAVPRHRHAMPRHAVPCHAMPCRVMQGVIPRIWK